MRKRRRSGASAYDHSLVGNLADWPISDLVQWVSQTGRTAMLRINCGDGLGHMLFKQGHLYHCRWGALAGETAFAALFELPAGEFRLQQREPPPSRRNVFRATQELLLCIAVQHDHAAQGLRAG